MERGVVPGRVVPGQTGRNGRRAHERVLHGQRRLGLFVEGGRLAELIGEVVAVDAVLQAAHGQGSVGGGVLVNIVRFLGIQEA